MQSNMKVYKIRITKDNINTFSIREHRFGTKEFIDDVEALKKKMIAYEKGDKSELTKIYPERYDLTVLTYSQNEEPFLINDGCHRIVAMREMLRDNQIKGFTFWLIPSNIIGANTKEEALELNQIVNKALDKSKLPHWVKKFDYELRDGKLIAWKNINLIDTGGQDTRLQYGVNWFLNEDPRRTLTDVDEHNYKNKYAL
jgi:hypothetical protein